MALINGEKRNKEVGWGRWIRDERKGIKGKNKRDETFLPVLGKRETINKIII